MLPSKPTYTYYIDTMSICFLNLLILLNLGNLTMDTFSNKSYAKYQKAFRALTKF